MNQLTFKRNDESIGIYETIHVIGKMDITDEMMAQINQHHIVEKDRYQRGHISTTDLHPLLGWQLGKLPEQWDLLIVSIKHMRHHRMDGAPDWVIRRPQDYYLSEAFVNIIYVGDWNNE